MDLATAMRETAAWTVEDQLELLGQVWDRLADSGWTPEVDPELQAELDQRAADLDENPDRAISWEQIIRSVKAQT